MDDHTEIRLSYLGGFSILLVEGFIWLLAGIVSIMMSVKIGILIIIIGGMFFYPLGVLVQIILKRPKIKKENSLNSLFTQIGLIIPFCFGVVFVVTNENMNLFFPALTVIVGVHYLPFIYAYKMKIYWLLASLLVAGGSFFGFMMQENFEYCAYYTGSLLLLFAFVNRFLVIKEANNAGL